MAHAARAAPGALLFGFFVGGDLGASSIGRFGAMVLAALGAAAVVGMYRFVEWQRLSYWFDGAGDLRIDSGVVERNERRVQLSRLQSVDVEQPFIPRLLGMAELRIDVAGASNATLAYLDAPTAQALRNEILARAAGLRSDAEEAPERVLVQVPPGDLAMSLLLQSTTVLLLLGTVLLISMTVAFEGFAALGITLVTGGVPLFNIVTQFTRFHGFTVAESADGLRLRYGLFQTTSTTVPPGRVQAVEFVESWLWQRLGWVRVEINVAGTAGGDADARSQVLLPVAPWNVARGVAARIIPGVDLDGVHLEPAPRRSRWRSPLQWSVLAVGHDDAVFVTRRGRLVRRHALVPHARTQSVRLTQGPWERWLRLASVHVDSTPGPVSISGLHLDSERARRIAEDQSDRAREARRRAGPERWMT